MSLLHATHLVGEYVRMLNELPTQRVTPALRFLASEARISQEKLAAKVGMSSSAMTRRLSGETPIVLSELERIAGALGYDVRVSLVERPRNERAA